MNYATMMTMKTESGLLVGDVHRRSLTIIVERWLLQFHSSHTPTPTSCPRWCQSYSTRCFSRATTSLERAQSVPRCTSSRRVLSTSLPRRAKWPPVCRTVHISEVHIFVHSSYCCRFIAVSPHGLQLLHLTPIVVGSDL